MNKFSNYYLILIQLRRTIINRLKLIKTYNNKYIIIRFMLFINPIEYLLLSFKLILFNNANNIIFFIMNLIKNYYK